MKKMLRITLSLAAAVILLLPVAVTVHGDLTAKHVADALANRPLPENTRLLERISRAGKLTGNGNGMQYFGAILVESELSAAELSAYYAGCETAPQTSQKITAIEHGTMYFETDVTGRTCCIIYDWGHSTSPLAELDLRGH